MQTQRIAVIVMNLGGPDSEKAIEPFLQNFFFDPNIIQLPSFLRRFVANTIAKKRSRGEARESYKYLGFCSPLLDHTKQQAAALEKELSQQEKSRKSIEFKTFVSMRYWHPMASEVMEDVKKWKADRIILLPLYPQFSTATSWSSFGEWQDKARQISFDVHPETICCYPDNHGFIKASTQRIKECWNALDERQRDHARLLFSAHGLPEKIIRSGDPYQKQCEDSAQAIAQNVAQDLGIKDLDWEICYQSRVGPLKWIGPSTEEALKKAASEEKGVLLYPHAFVSEHVETLVEIDIEYRQLAEELGIPFFKKVETVGIHPDFITGLAELVWEVADKGAKGQRQCPKGYARCFYNLSQTHKHHCEQHKKAA